MRKTGRASRESEATAQAKGRSLRLMTRERPFDVVRAGKRWAQAADQLELPDFLL